MTQIRQDKDLKATKDIDNFFDHDKAIMALGMVVADVISKAYGIPIALARQEVKKRATQYYRSLL
jgi:hypothetical protein